MAKSKLGQMSNTATTTSGIPSSLFDRRTFFNKSPDEEKEEEEEESLGLIVGVNESPPFNLGRDLELPFRAVGPQKTMNDCLDRYNN